MQNYIFPKIIFIILRLLLNFILLTCQVNLLVCVCVWVCLCASVTLHTWIVWAYFYPYYVSVTTIIYQGDNFWFISEALSNSRAINGWISTRKTCEVTTIIPLATLFLFTTLYYVTLAVPFFLLVKFTKMSLR